MSHRQKEAKRPVREARIEERNARGAATAAARHESEQEYEASYTPRHPQIDPGKYLSASDALREGIKHPDGPYGQRAHIFASEIVHKHPDDPATHLAEGFKALDIHQKPMKKARQWVERVESGSSERER